MALPSSYVTASSCSPRGPWFRVALLALAVVIWTPKSALAGPPYQTDDPEPTPYKNWEIYFGWNYARDSGDFVTSAFPALEFDYGALPNVQVSLSTQFTYARESGGVPHYTFGDTELGAKVRFVQETAQRPQVAFYPAILVPQGGAEPTRTFVPIWVQKSSGPWTVFGGLARDDVGCRSLPQR